jgi:hypothetical protein
MATIAQLEVLLTANAKPLKKGFKEAEASASGFSGFMSSLGGGAASLLGVGSALAVAGAAIGVVTTGIAAWTEQDQALKKLNATLAATGNQTGFTAGELEKMGSDLMQVTNFADETTHSAIAILATFKEIHGETFKSAVEAAQDLSAVFGSDLQTSAVQIGKALNDPIAGMTALKRIGVSFTEEQKKQIANLMKMGDLQGAQNIIVKELQTEVGGAAKKMAEPWQQFKNTAGEMFEEIGRAPSPIKNGVLAIGGGIVAFIGEAFKTVREIVGLVTGEGLFGKSEDQASEMAATMAAQKEDAEAIAESAEKREKVEKAIADIEKQARQAGMTSSQKAADNVGAAGGNAIDMRRAASLQEEIESRQKIAGVVKEIADIEKESWVAALPPLEKRLELMKLEGATVDQIAAARKALTVTEEATKGLEDRKAITEQIKHLNEEAAQAGLKGAEKEVALAMTHHATEQDIAKIKEAAVARDAANEAAKVAEEAAKERKDLEKQIVDLQREGLTNAEKQAAIARDRGASEEEAAKVQGIVQRAEDQKKAKELIKDGKTAQEQFADKAKEINGLFGQNLLTKEQRDAALKKAQEETTGKDLNHGEHSAVGALVRGSAEAYKAANANSSTDALLKQQLDEAKKQTAALNNIAGENFETEVAAVP